MDAQAERIAGMIITGGTYAKASLQLFWPSKQEMLHNRYTGRINLFSESNLTLHISRAFAENDFSVWAEVPFYTRYGGRKSDLTLDFLAYDKNSETAVMIELKNNIDTPQGVFKDIYRFTYLQKEGHGLCHDAGTGNGMCIHEAKQRFYGIITVLHQKAFTDWWETPKKEGVDPYMPLGKRASLYGIIGQILNDFSAGKGCLDLGAFGCSVAYALFRAEDIDALSQSTLLQQGRSLIDTPR